VPLSVRRRFQASRQRFRASLCGNQSNFRHRSAGTAHKRPTPVLGMLYNYWMYNSMSKQSFGRFASHPAFSLSRMATQYMWWNWVESVDWSSGAVRVLPRKAGAGRW
jgi:hypothetical protein